MNQKKYVNEVINDLEKYLKQIKNNEISFEDFNKKFVDIGLESRPSLTELTEKEMLKGLRNQIENDNSYYSNHTNGNFGSKVSAQNFGFYMYDETKEMKNFYGYYNDEEKDYYILKGIKHHNNDKLFVEIDKQVADIRSNYNDPRKEWDGRVEIDYFLQQAFTKKFNDLIDEIDESLNIVFEETNRKYAVKGYKINKLDLKPQDLKLIYNQISYDIKDGEVYSAKEIVTDILKSSNKSYLFETVLDDIKIDMTMKSFKNEYFEKMYKNELYKNENKVKREEIIENLIEKYYKDIKVSNDDLIFRYEIQPDELPDFKIFFNGEYAYGTNCNSEGKDKDGNFISLEAFNNLNKFLKGNDFNISNEKDWKDFKKFLPLQDMNLLSLYCEEDGKVIPVDNYNYYTERTVKNKLREEFKNIIEEVDDNIKLTLNDRGKYIFREEEYALQHTKYTEDIKNTLEEIKKLENELRDIRLKEGIVKIVENDVVIYDREKELKKEKEMSM